MADPSNVLNNSRAAYSTLLERVTNALRTQVGDPLRLGAVRQQVLFLAATTEQVSKIKCSYVNFLFIVAPAPSSLPSRGVSNHAR